MDGQVDGQADGVLTRIAFNGNVFFSSWGALIISLVLCTSQFKTFCNRRDDEHIFQWVGFAVSGIVVMSRLSRFYNDSCDDTVRASCARSVFGLVLGLVSFIVGISIVAFRVGGVVAESISSAFVVAWCFGVAYLTFGQGSPGALVGTLYFATWLSLFLALSIATPALHERCHSLGSGTADDDSPDLEEKHDDGKEKPADVDDDKKPADVADDKKPVDGKKSEGDDAEEEEVAVSSQV